jgi:hypothetical protein
MGVALAGAIFNYRLPAAAAAVTAAGVDQGQLASLAFTHALHDTLLIGAAVAVLGMITSLVRGPRITPAGSPAVQARN